MEYRTLLASDSDTIELSTENGKTVICRKQAKEMEQYLDQAEILLQDVIQSRDISTLVVLHHLRDLAEVLDNLKLYDECRLAGNCALDLAEALGRRSLEFRQEQAETLALIAGLSVYQPHARTLFIQAVSICEEVVENNASHSNKNRLLIVLDRAGYWAPDDLCAQWLGRAVQLMTKELPPTMVRPHFRSVIYNNYGNGLHWVKQYADAVEAYHEAVSIHRRLASNDPTKYNPYLAPTLISLASTLDALGKYGDAIDAHKEAMDICTAMSAQDPLLYNTLMARALCNHGLMLGNLKQVAGAAEVGKQAISLCRNLAQAGNECTPLLCRALHIYGHSCSSLGQHAESVLAYQECILLRRALAATDSQEEINLIGSLLDISNSFLALGKYGDAIAAHKEGMDICTAMAAQDPLLYNTLMARALCNHGLMLKQFNQVPEAAEVEKQAISLCRNLAQTGNECTPLLCRALHNYGHSCSSLGQHAESVLAYQESILLRRALAATDSIQERNLISSLHDISNSFVLDKHAEADAAAIEGLERNHGRVLEHCDYAPNFKACFMCQKAVMTDSPGAGSPPLPYLLADSSQPTEQPGAAASLTPAETSTSAHIPPIGTC